MKFIDVHTHIYPEKIAIKATSALSTSFNKKSDWPATAENLVIFQTAAGISRSVVLPVAIRENQVRKINEFVIESRNEFPQHIIGFGALHAELADQIGEIDFMKASGLEGIKLHPDQQGFDIDDERLFDAYSYLSQIGLPVLFHCGDQKSDRSHPQRLKHLIALFPQLKIIGAHFGGWTVFDQAHDILCRENIHFDMSSSMYLMGLEKTARFIRDYGAEKIFFGTDFPLCDAEKEIQDFMSLDITMREKEAIASGNFESFMGYGK